MKPFFHSEHNNRKLFNSFNCNTSLILISVFTILVSSNIANASDPTSLPDENIFGLGVDIGFDQRDFDSEQTVTSSRVIGNMNYTILKYLQVYLESGLFKTETHHGEKSDWGLGVALGLRGYIAEFQDGNIRIGFDGKIFRSQTDYSAQMVADNISTEEDITQTEYMLTLAASWRAYKPITLYTGIRLSNIDVDYEITTYHWDTKHTSYDTVKAGEDQMIGLLWGITYQLAENVELFSELEALSTLSVSAGFHFNF